MIAGPLLFAGIYFCWRGYTKWCDRLAKPTSKPKPTPTEEPEQPTEPTRKRLSYQELQQLEQEINEQVKQQRKQLEDLGLPADALLYMNGQPKTKLRQS